MKKIIYTSSTLFLIAAVLLIGSCKKTTVNGLVKSTADSYTSNGQTTNSTAIYTYDGQNRLTEYQPGSGTPTTISYGSGSVTVTQGSSVTIYQLNSSGYATSDNQGNIYVYDNNGFNTTTTNTGANTTNVFSISNGNVSSEQSTVNGVTTTYAYTYLSTADYRTYGLKFLGKNSVNLVNTESISNPNTTTYTFSYTFDSKGRVQTQTYISGTTTDVTTYTYVD